MVVYISDYINIMKFSILTSFFRITSIPSIKKKLFNWTLLFVFHVCVFSWSLRAWEKSRNLIVSRLQYINIIAYRTTVLCKLESQNGLVNFLYSHMYLKEKKTIFINFTRYRSYLISISVCHLLLKRIKSSII